MSRQLEQKIEERSARREQALIRAIEFELVGSLDMYGYTLDGLAARFDDFDCLLTLKARVNEDRFVSFVGSDSFGNALLKAVRDAKEQRLRWKADKYTPSGD